MFPCEFSSHEIEAHAIANALEPARPIGLAGLNLLVQAFEFANSAIADLDSYTPTGLIN